RKVLALTPKLTLGEANGRLLLNGEQLSDRDQVRPPIVSFLSSLNKRSIFSIILNAGITTEEFGSFLEILAQTPEEIQAAGGVSELLTREGVSHVLVNERRFVSVGKDEELTTMTEGGTPYREGDEGVAPGAGGGEADLLRLKDEEIARLKELVKDEQIISLFLQRQVQDAGPELIEDAVANPPRLGMLVRKALQQIELEEDGEAALQRSLDCLDKVASMVGSLPEEDLAQMDREEIAQALSAMPANRLKDYLLNDLPEAVEQMQLRSELLKNMKETRTLELLESVLWEHERLKREQPDVPGVEDERLASLSGLIDELYKNSGGKEWESTVADRIFQADMWKKIVGSGEGASSAGSNSLIYQVSNLLVHEGVALDVDELALDPAIDRSVPRMLQKLYRSQRSDAADKLLHNMMDNLNDISPEIRLKTAEVLQNVPEALDLPKRGRNSAIAYELKDALSERLEKERQLTEVYEELAGGLKQLGKAFILNQEYGPAMEIIDQFWEHYSSAEARKPEQQEAALRNVTEMADPQVIESLTRVLRSGDVATIASVANILIKFEDKSVQPLIQVLKDSEDMMIRKVTFDALENIGKDAIRDLINDLQETNPWHMYRNIVSILAEIGNRSSLQSLSRFMKHQNEAVRRETVRAIGRIKSPETVDLLLMALKDRDETVQQEACRALGVIADVSTVPALLEVVKGRRGLSIRRHPLSVRIAAVWALGNIGDHSVVTELSRLLRKRRLFKDTRQQEELRREAARALASIGSPEALEILRNSASGGTGPMQEAATSALAGTKP
ncbi:MAG: HEAT repeat domain-containing protein, partial [Candidatus Geothermincolia bacterium]